MKPDNDFWESICQSVLSFIKQVAIIVAIICIFLIGEYFLSHDVTMAMASIAN